MPEVSLWSVELENVGQVAPGVKKRYHGAWSQARLWQWTPVVFAGLEVTPTLQCNSDLGGGHPAHLSPSPLPHNDLDAHLTQISPLVFELCAFVEELEKKENSLLAGFGALTMLT